MKKLLLLICMSIGLMANVDAQNCRALFQWNQSPNSPTVAFYDSSYVTNGGTVSTWAWNFGDGSTSHDQNPTHTYNASGSYRVCLVITSNYLGSVCTSDHCDTINVLLGGTNCHAEFAYSGNAVNPLAVSFTNNSTGTNNTTGYQWSFGDSTYSTSFDPNHTYSNPGTYNVCLTINVRDAQQNLLCTNRYCQTVTVGNTNTSCNAAFTYTAAPINHLELSFANTSTGVTNSTTTYRWEFGDSTFSSLRNPTHTYSHAGNYHVCLIVTVRDSQQNVVCVDDYCTNVTVNTAATPCNASFTAAVAPINHLEVKFTNTSTGVANTFASYAWSFGDSTSSNLSSPSHNYQAAGTYSVCLTITVRDAQQNITCMDDYCTTITVTGNTSNCGAAFQYTHAANNPLEIAFQNYSSGTNPTYAWSFGDGSTSSNFDPHHAYAHAGSYAVCLTVTTIATATNPACTSTYCDSITVGSAVSCHAGFTFAVAPVNHLEVKFTNTSSGANTNNTTYQWTFGDGTSSSTASPSHNYTAAGTYQVCLLITTYDSLQNVVCRNDVCHAVTVGNNVTSCNISGIIFRGNNRATAATVYLIHLDSLNLIGVDTVTTVNGEYVFTNVPAGNYYVKAALTPNDADYTHYLPTYYQHVSFWHYATVVNVCPTRTGVNIYLIPGSNPGGPGFVGGLVTQGANKQAGDPLEGIQVMWLNTDESPVQYTYTLSNGSFSFDDVAYGTYKVYAEIVGKPTYPPTITISAAKESVTDVSLVVESEGVYTGLSVVEVTFIDQTKLYPNPMSGSANLTFNAKEAGNVTLQVVNMLGQVVAEQQLTVEPGSQNATVDISNQQAGIYFLSISFNNQVAAHIRFLKD
ncbi:hypothetical protein BH09BAC1_BH09BAC1_10950 [soil metagenome]